MEVFKLRIERCFGKRIHCLSTLVLQSDSSSIAAWLYQWHRKPTKAKFVPPRVQDVQRRNCDKPSSVFGDPSASEEMATIRWWEKDATKTKPPDSETPRHTALSATSEKFSTLSCCAKGFCSISTTFFTLSSCTVEACCWIAMVRGSRQKLDSCGY